MMPTMNVLAAHLRNVSSTRRAIYAFLAGLVTVVAFPPIGFFPILWLSFPLLFVLTQNATTKKQTFALGWCFAFAQLMAGLYWMTIALFVDLATYWWMVPFALAGLPAFIALFYGVAVMIARRIALHGIAGCLAFALMWFLADYARGNVLSGLPWNLEGYSWYRVLSVMQYCSVAGIYSLTFLTLIAASLPALLITHTKNARTYALTGIAVFALIALWGAQHMTVVIDVLNVRLRLVQPNIAQEFKWAETQRAANFDQLIDLSSQPVSPGDAPVTDVIWPETASPYYLAADVPHRLKAVAALPEGAKLLTGVVRADWDPNQDTPHAHYYNSLLVFDKTGSILAMYDKVHLVPFGEYMPLRKLFTGVKAVAAMGEGFSHGEHAETLHVDGLPPFSPLICFEGIFPGKVADRSDRPSLLLNITNDAWYGRSSGPYQHLAIAATRAIEEGLPLVRAANTGISVMVDPYGRILARKELGERGFIDVNVPEALPPTPFVKYGEIPLWGLFTILGIFTFSRKYKTRNSHN